MLQIFKIHCHLIIFFLSIILQSCETSLSENNEKIDSALIEFKNELHKIENITNSKSTIEQLTYLQSNLKKKIIVNDYQRSKNGLITNINAKCKTTFYSPINNNTNTDSLIFKAAKYEQLDSLLKAIKNSSELISHTFFIDTNAALVTFPKIDIENQLSQRTNLKLYPFYPSSKENAQPIFYFTPFIDPLGHGWCVFYKTPIYANNIYIGNLICCINLEQINTFFNDHKFNYLIINKNGTMLSASIHVQNVLFLPHYQQPKYIFNQSFVTIQKSNYNLQNAKSKDLRFAINSLLTSQSNEIKISECCNEILLSSKTIDNYPLLIIEATIIK